ncbi:dTDP-glucose 4,6-dehydratase [Robiginitalea myxolifaciens]|uniref:dTDP-glucose 4,6-dehydratase n=1 Tax=Robiginitalea myxolifaciens TaxID=400055 RepID=A0A1I6G2P6_9FLAO|nr:dTDP-glucose 4,6-dehydratase [Robiginitalea myxolifaciens]SFR36464.1 dTDP-glucose 4,6-dehydratase [Robiginitalea myxolifaciens]
MIRKLEQETILVTGGAGFIGSNLVGHLLNVRPGLRIINLDALTYAGSKDNLSEFIDNKAHIFVHGDIRDRELVDQLFGDYNITGVIHLAAESHVDNSIDSPEPFIDTNIRGTYELLEASRRHWAGANTQGGKFHQVSTDEVFGSLGKEGHFTESSPYAPNSPYSASKAAADMLVRSYNKTYGLDTAISNCSNNYGPNQHAEKLIPTIIRTALAGEQIPIYGDGSNVRDWLFVADHCDALLRIFEQASPGSQYLIGGGYECSNLEIASTICAELDRIRPKNQGKYEDQITLVADRPGHDFRYAVSNSKIDRELGWKPATDFKAGISATVQWHVENRIKH